jgi:hypothetical protein
LDAVDLYAEIGLGAGFDVTVSMRAVGLEHRLGSDRVLSRGGLGDLEIAIERALLGRGAHALALFAGARLSPYAAPSELELEDGVPRLGPGGGDLLLGASYGRAFSSGWIAIDLVDRIRFPGASTGILLRTELGRTLFGPLQGAIDLELGPAFGRDHHRSPGDPAPVAKVLSLGGKLFVDVFAGFGVLLEGAWLPPALNDGSGVRGGLSLYFRG